VKWMSSCVGITPLEAGSARCTRRFASTIWPGADPREQLLRVHFGDGIDAALGDKRRLGCGADDILDAFVALWTARRMQRGEAVCIPEAPPLDAYGLRMEMVA